MTKLLPLFLIVALMGCADTADAPADPATDMHEMEGHDMDHPTVTFASPVDGATVPPTFPVMMSAEHVAVVPAGTMEDGTGHMHILIDTDFIAPGQVIPSDAQHLHFGDGSTETELTLSPGTHTLRLQLADGAHRAFDGSGYQDEITITVRAEQ